MLHARVEALAAARVGENFETFAAAFSARDVPEHVLRTVYGKLQEWMQPIEGFAVRASDDIGDVYGIVGEDHDDLCLQLIVACGGREPSFQESRRFGDASRVIDVVELVLYARAGYRVEWRRWNDHRAQAI